MKVAIVADWLTTYAGSERVLEQIIACYPEADVFAVADFVPENMRVFLQGKQPVTTFIQKLPFAKRLVRHYLPLMPMAIEQLDLSAYHVILSSSHAVAKGVIVGPDQLHISYVHTPIRYAWELQHQYIKESGFDQRWIGWLARWMLHKIRPWDVRTHYGVDCFIANSKFIARRIKRVYRRDASVIYPPVDVDAFALCVEKEDFYLTASRMVPYKRIGLIVDAFAKMPDKKLVVIGDGPELLKIKNKATANVTLMGHQPFEILRDHMQRAKAFIFAAEEDFGILPVEAQACGTPVIAFAKGGALETISNVDKSNNPTGLFFEEQTTFSIINAVDRFELMSGLLDPTVIRQHAERFSKNNFAINYKKYVESAIKDWRENQEIF